MKKIILILTLFYSASSEAESLDEIIEVLKFVETTYNPDAVGDFDENGIPKSYGILQIQQGAIDDVNRRYGTSYTHEDAFQIACAEEIFKLYIQMWTEHLNKKEGREATSEDIVRIWNGGPRGYKKKSTIPYLVKFEKNKYLCNIMEKQKCIVGGKLGVVLRRYTHTMDVYLFKSKMTRNGVNKRYVKLLPAPKQKRKKKTNQLALQF